MVILFSRIAINKDFIRRFIYQFDQNKGHKFISDYINGIENRNPKGF